MFTQGKKCCAVYLLIGIASLACCGLAYGVAMPATANIIQIEATGGGHTATFEEVFPVGSFDGLLNWSLPAPLNLVEEGINLGSVNSLEVMFDADPQVDLNFSLVNNNLNYPVMFTISTATIAFTPVPNAQAAASASVTLTQGAGSPEGASITGLFPNDKIYQARYSTTYPVNSQTVFADLCSSMSFASGLGTSGTETVPPVGFTNLGTTVYMMESQFKFILSPGDQASGTSAFLIIPEPASILSLLAVAGLLLLKRR